MSSHAAAPRVSPNSLVATVMAYNTLVEHTVLMTPAEYRLATALVHAGAHRQPVGLSDATWEKWTGLDPRSMEIATKGLLSKGFEVQGRGRQARYRFDFDPNRKNGKWMQFISTAERQCKPRSAGRKADPPKKPALHPDCEGGCELARRAELNLVLADKNAKRVSHNTAPSGAEQSTPTEGGVQSPNAATCLAQKGLTLIQNAKHVSQNSAQVVEQQWARSLAALRAIFPLVGLGFLARLVAVVIGLFCDLSDLELADAIGFAWNARGRYQKSEGLFLLTVPDAVRALREQKARAATQAALDAPKPVPLPLPWDDAIERLRARGAPFARHIPDLESLIEQWKEPGTLNLAELEARASSIEFALHSTILEHFAADVEFHSAVLEAGEQAVAHIAEALTERRDRIRRQAELAETFRRVELPAISWG
jgi:hypothetical protein